MNTGFFVIIVMVRTLNLRLRYENHYLFIIIHNYENRAILNQKNMDSMLKCILMMIIIIIMTTLYVKIVIIPDAAICYL